MEPTNWPLTGCGTDMKKAKIAHWPNNQCLSMYVSTDQVRTDVARINQLQVILGHQKTPTPQYKSSQATVQRNNGLKSPATLRRNGRRLVSEASTKIDQSHQIQFRKHG